MGTETRAQALRGAPGAKTPQIEGSNGLIYLRLGFPEMIGVEESLS